MASNPEHTYDDFDPVSDLLPEKECDTLLLYLPGFRKDQLKVQITSSRILRISGERPTGENNKWKRFRKEFNVPSNVDVTKMTAKYEGGILYIRQPKLITPATTEQQQNQGKTAAEPTASQPQQEAPTEGKMEKKDAEDEMERKEKDETTAQDNKDKKGKRALDELRKQVGGGSELFKELRKPEKLIRLAVYVILVLILGFHITKMFKSFTKIEEQSILENSHQEF